MKPADTPSTPMTPETHTVLPGAAPTWVCLGSPLPGLRMEPVDRNLHVSGDDRDQ